MKTAYAIAWLAAGVLHYGLIVGHFQNKFPDLAEENRTFDRSFATVAIIGGPVSLVAFFGMRLLSPTRQNNPPLTWQL